MKNKILIILLSALIAVSFVSGELGDELVTCGEFDCATPDDFWSNLGTGSCQAKWFVESITEGLRMQCGSADPTNSNTSQDIKFKAGKSYNVTLTNFVSNNFRANATFYISDNSTFLENTDSSAIVSWIAKPTVNGNLTINGQIRTSRNDISINSISVREILPPPNIIMRYDDKTATVPENIIERFDDGTIEISVPKNIFRRFVRWIRNLA